MNNDKQNQITDVSSVRPLKDPATLAAEAEEAARAEAQWNAMSEEEQQEVLWGNFLAAHY